MIWINEPVIKLGKVRESFIRRCRSSEGLNLSIKKSELIASLYDGDLELTQHQETPQERTY